MEWFSLENSFQDYRQTMPLRFGGHSWTQHLSVHWSEKEGLLHDETQYIPNPCFLDAGKSRHRQLSAHQEI